MSKQEFLKVLKETLSQELTGNEVQGHIQYYEEYINGEIRSGRSEEEVTNSLGDPRLIAKTILETSGSDNFAYGGAREQTSYDSSFKRGGDYGTQDGDWASESRDFSHGHMGKWNGSSVLRLVLGILIAVGVISLVVSLVSALIPVVLPVVAVILLLSYLRKRY